jgi:hypothetical protein
MPCLERGCRAKRRADIKVGSSRADGRLPDASCRYPAYPIATGHIIEIDELYALVMHVAVTIVSDPDGFFAFIFTMLIRRGFCRYVINRRIVANFYFDLIFIAVDDFAMVGAGC